MTNDKVGLSVDVFGNVENPVTKNLEEVKRYTWTNKNGMSVQVISYGAIITSIKVPDREGNVADVVLGFDDIPGYKNPLNPYFGAVIGRVANRIARGEFVLNGVTYHVAKNWNGIHHLHGGITGFDKFNWIPCVEGTTLYLSHLNEDGFEGYPGHVLTTLKYELSADNEFSMSISATSTKPTPINLTNHSYFNLAGHETGHEELYRHVITMNADKITETDSESIPTGRFTCVGGTPFDLRLPKEIGPSMAKITAAPGYDDNFCVTKVPGQDMAFVARVVHPGSGRILEVFSDQPGVQLYTSNFIPDPCDDIKPKEHNEYYEVDGVLTTKLEKVSVTTMTTVQGKGGSCNKKSPLTGKGGVSYYKHQAFCLETQKYPDAVHHDNFPSTILNPGEVYKHEVVYKFGLTENKTC